MKIPRTYERRLEEFKGNMKGGQDAHPTRELANKMDFILIPARKKDILLESLTALL